MYILPSVYIIEKGYLFGLFFVYLCRIMVIIYPQILQLKCGLAYRNKIQSAGFRDSCQFGRGAMNDWVSCPNVGHCLIWDNLGLEHLSLILKHANE